MTLLSPAARHWRAGLYWLFAVTMLNYLAQIPYYVHFYGVYHAAPSTLGIALLSGTCLVFLVGFFLALRKRRSGWWLLLGFFALEFVFYVVHNLSGAFLQDLPLHDPIFLAVSVIGYLNTVVALIALIALIRKRSPLFSPKGE